MTLKTLKSKTPVIAHVGTPILLAIAVNAIVFYYWDSKSRQKEKRSPLPGAFIGIVWVILFGLLGYSRYLLVSSGAMYESYVVTFVLVFCILYPFYTNGMSVNIALANTISFIVIFCGAIVVYSASTTAFAYYVPTMLWVAFVNMMDAIYLDRK